MAKFDNDKKSFKSLAILNFHKYKTDNIELVFVGNYFVAKYSERYSTFSKSDFV